MQQSYTAQILLEIANQINKPPSAVQPFIQILEDNWFDSRESLATVTDQDFQTMKIPLKIIQLIKEKINQQPNQLTQQQPQQQLQQTQQKPEQYQQILSQIQTPEQNLMNDLESQVQIIVSEIKEIPQLLKTLQTINKILTNVIESPLNPQFYSIKLGSKTLSLNIMTYQSAWRYLERNGWQIEGEYMKLQQDHLDLQGLKTATEILQNKIEMFQKPQPSSFDPYKAYFSATSDSAMTNSDVAQKVGYNIYSFSEQLDMLKQYRYDIMSKIPLNRDIKVHQGNVNQSVHEIFQQISEKDDFEVQPSQDPLLREFLKKIAISLDEQKFASKRKKEFDDLFKRPVYNETIIRIKLPSNIIFESKFGPLEKLGKVFDILRQNLQNPDIKIFLYTTPPVQKMTQKYLTQTLDDLDCVPSGLFYVGFENANDEAQNQFLLKQDIKTNKMR